MLHDIKFHKVKWLWVGVWVGWGMGQLPPAFARVSQNEKPALHSNRRVSGAGIKIGVGPASIYGYGTPTFAIAQLKERLRGQAGKNSTGISGLDNGSMTGGDGYDRYLLGL